MYYLIFKTVHIASVTVWIGGMLMSGGTLATVRRSMEAGMQDGTQFFVQWVRRWDRMVTTPAMLLVWAMGLTLAMQGGWFGESWLTAKLVLVLVLSAIHGMLSGRLRRLLGPQFTKTSGWSNWAGPAVVVMATAIIFLVVVKPF